MLFLTDDSCSVEVRGIEFAPSEPDSPTRVLPEVSAKRRGGGGFGIRGDVVLVVVLVVVLTGLMVVLLAEWNSEREEGLEETVLARDGNTGG